MKINELQPESTFDEIKARLLSKQGPQIIKIKGRRSYLWQLLLIDETGTIALTLWGVNAADEFRIGQVLKVTDGWCKVFGDIKQISKGKAGNIEVVADDPVLPRSLPV
ncbi:MAG: hypothetical protein OEZ01_02580 [Candidatus Heimdallarchaeota archaeon]|nr:hypothetical protein [Candidatus Heimdallarchaeota archaeon]MDH5644862.1 hypothetical protein [Candidatus Heimdallarchaeota archaeon]